MKKGFIAGAALALALAAPVTVFAEEGADSPTTGDAKIVIESRTENAGVKVGDTAAVVNEKWGTSIADGYVVVFVGEAYVTPAGTPNVTLTVNASSFNGGEIFVHHKKDGSNDVNGTVTLNSNDLSPVCTLAKASGGKTTPTDNSTANTGDSNNTGLWAGALIISALLAGAAFAINKRNA